MGRVRDLKILAMIVLVLIAVAAVLYACRVAGFAMTALSAAARKGGHGLASSIWALAAGRGARPAAGGSNLRAQIH